MERYSDPFEDFDVYQDSPNVIARPPRVVLAFLAAGFVLDQFMLRRSCTSRCSISAGPGC
jgi:hypothetical protein